MNGAQLMRLLGPHDRATRLNAHAAVSVIQIDLRVATIDPHLKIEMWGTRHRLTP